MVSLTYLHLRSLDNDLAVSRGLVCPVRSIPKFIDRPANGLRIERRVVLA